MLKEALALKYTFVQSDMRNVRSHMLLQLLRQRILVSEYGLEHYLSGAGNEGGSLPSMVHLP